MELWDTDLLLVIHLIGNPSRKIKNKKHNKGDYEGHSPILCEQYENRRVCDIVLSLKVLNQLEAKELSRK